MNEYAQRINRVIDYIDSHLSEELSLEQLAGVACFSPFHFHRIFQTATGETLFKYIQRIRLEKSAQLLLIRPGEAVLNIALDCGFSNPAAFTRAFKLQFEETPSQWRKKKENRNLSIAHSNSCKEAFSWQPYTEYQQDQQRWRMRKDSQERVVDVKKMEARSLLYTRYSGPYQGDGQLFQQLWKRLCSWAGARGLIGKDTEYLVLYHDDPELTDHQKLRVTVALTLPAEAEVEAGEMGRMELEEGLYAQAHFRLNSQEYGEAWNWVYREWLPQSGYTPDDRPSFEYFPAGEEGEKQEKDGRYPVDICIPLAPR